MRTAPAVSVPCSLGGAWRVFQALTAASAAAAFSAWALGHLQATLWPAAAAALAAGALAWRLARCAPVVLAWDGRQWTANGIPGALDVMLDLGPWLLLRLRPVQSRPALWLPVSAAGAGAALHSLRAAAYSRTPVAGPGVRPAAPGHLAEAD